MWKPNSGLFLMGTFQHYTQTGMVDTTPSSTCGTLCTSCPAPNPSSATPSSNLVPPGQDSNEENPKNRGEHYMRIPGDLDIPVILSISEPGYFDHYDGYLCGHLDENEVLTTEALLYALDKVNADPNMFPGTKLGITVMDSCRRSVITTRQLAGVLGQTTNLEASGPALGILGPETDDVAEKVVEEITAPAGLITVCFICPCLSKIKMATSMGENPNGIPINSQIRNSFVVLNYLLAILGIHPPHF